jgi:hypothetical protein
MTAVPTKANGNLRIAMPSAATVSLSNNYFFIVGTSPDNIVGDKKRQEKESVAENSVADFNFDATNLSLDTMAALNAYGASYASPTEISEYTHSAADLWSPEQSVSIMENLSAQYQPTSPYDTNAPSFFTGAPELVSQQLNAFVSYLDFQ